MVEQLIVEGRVSPGYEPVKELYERNMRNLVERNTQLCIYVGEECVVDLWASAIGDTQFSGDSLVNVFSSGKGLEAILLARLVDQGLLDYNAKITQYWPEFGGNSGTTTTVADLMRHEGGLAALDTTLTPDSMHPESLLQNSVGTIIELQTQRYRPGEGNQREYHAISRGWIANELFRRIDPAGRTMGQALRAEISEPLGADVHLGLTDEEIQRISPVAMLGFGYQFRQGLVPKFMGRRMELNLAQTMAKLVRLAGGARKRTTSGMPIPITGMKDISVVDSPALAKAEFPSAGAKCSARGLAKLAAAMANGGRFGDQTILSDTAHQALHDVPVRRQMMSMDTSFTQGGLATFPPPETSDNKLARGLNRGREGFYGWMGLGGSIFQWHPDHKIGFGYVPTSLNVLDIVNERGKAYQAKVMECVNR